MPLPIDTTALVNSLRAQLTDLDKQIEAIKRDVLNDFPIHVKPSPEFVYRAKYKDGKFMLADLLVARSNTLVALANLQVSLRK